uniref:V-SNARE coiled-coil homology domain-containing protein n=1 Tax=Chromera velia CCMP2878 TaxID=1169474 RepID=A0A0G4H257_9ALVE|eukprot:Cvel_24396.t1-p1 / transcript=Cvel_24396.t1 / gene=Cvel_24396 / organism=Chromera_velia_CCMP2878 / gene_product=Synaptobrevin homolog ykt6, putative / transcript_product=Synaptobrevin homolog ykt6, putative / location=Cvel_scaffold2631:22679-24825(+) / protein_length=179 / sequence_SO=supercontig / SO=protein_coding / is_pseudo=false
MELGSFSFFERGTIKEHIRFHSRLIASRTPVGKRQSIAFENNLGMCHAYTHPCGLTACVLSDAEYPMRVAFTLISELLRVFQEKFAGQWEDASADMESLQFPEGDDFLKKFQNPAEADKLTKVQKDLDEVKDVVMQSIEDLLKRGETLDALMQKSQDLSTTSYQFYKTAKKNNQCCKLY